ncbi:Acyl-CoA dehydrogenase [Paraburkholderia unamae]|uniref:acyl-CoA dehydrogenase family protein n=1 Tax=Paraburkholderia unamae TaxID=219649 RepID=UPI001CAFB0FE|nr:acyl-CoA dehydrogenase family protein [Paraburkholderia unamae]CAG9266052.1 Acyl-CoA dehydrogenase [Paraburkholderia unamae]
MLDQSLPETFTLANAELGRVRWLLDEAVLAVVRSCCIAGELDTQRLDEYQPASYEIAFASAELLAAETTCAPQANATELDARLSLAFAAEAIGSVLSRLDTLYVDLGIPPTDLHAQMQSIDLVRLRHVAARSDALVDLGECVAQADDIARIAKPEDVAMAQDAFRRFAEEVVAPLAERIHREDETIPNEILDGMRAMGAFGLSIPAAYGGSASSTGDDTQMMVAVTEVLAQASLAAAGSLITRPEILSRALLSGGTDEQKRAWLPPIASGETLCAIAITEPDFGSDVAALTLKGTRVEGGWRLDGAKTWCTFAGMANLLMVVTRTDPDKRSGHRGLSIMLVEKPSFDAHAFEYVQPEGGRLDGRAIPTIGYRGMHSFDLHFENYFVPDTHVLGGEAGLGRGFYYTMAGMTGGRMQTAARATGVMRAALDAAIRYAADRKVFGAPLSEFPLTRLKISRMAARYAACRKLTYAIAARLERGGSQMEASLVKLIACRSAESVTREALQIHGGMGYAEESAVSRYFVDARVLSIFEGAEETLALKVIARALYDDAFARLTSKREAQHAG